MQEEIILINIFISGRNFMIKQFAQIFTYGCEIYDFEIVDFTDNPQWFLSEKIEKEKNYRFVYIVYRNLEWYQIEIVNESRMIQLSLFLYLIE